MPKASKTTASETVEVEGGRRTPGEPRRGLHRRLRDYTADADLTELFIGLPVRPLPGTHWGYVSWAS